MDRLKSGMSWLSSKLPMVKHVLQNINHPIAEKSAAVLNALGYGRHANSNKLENRLQ
jgi:hypothetical protein